MKQYIAATLFCLFSTALPAQTGDEAVMRIGDREVPRAELEYAYQKNGAQNRILLSDFVQAFIHLKLQALEAESRGLDTLASFREKMEQLAVRLDRPAPEPLSAPLSDRRPSPRLAHLFIYLPQNSSSRTIQRACNKMDSVYRAASADSSLERCARQCEENPACGIFGEIATLPSGHTMEEVERRIRALRTGEMSRPFVSAAGVHLVQVLGQEEAEPDENHADTECDKEDETQAFLQKEWREALLREALLAEQSAQPVTPEQLAAYFKKNKKHYQWELPHYKGAALYCKDKSSAKELKKILKKVPLKQWGEVVEQYNLKYPGKEAKIECGLFQIGRNPAVDKVVFGQGSFSPSSDYPYVTAIGKKLKKGPEEYEDVGRRVERDYKASREAEEIAGWLKKYKVEINQEVLKTVNNH